MAEGGGGGGGGGGGVGGGPGNRPRLRPWLMRHLNEGTMPGLEWLDRGAGKFKIAWMHGGNQSWSAERYPIFQAWSRETGKFRQGIDKEDKTVFKDRLRNALNKARTIEEVKAEHSTESVECYRVYRFCNADDSSVAFNEDDESPQPVSLLAQDISGPDNKGVPQIPTTVEDLCARSLQSNNNGVQVKVEYRSDRVEENMELDHIDSDQLFAEAADANLSITDALNSSGQFDNLASAELGATSLDTAHEERHQSPYHTEFEIGTAGRSGVTHGQVHQQPGTVALSIPDSNGQLMEVDLNLVDWDILLLQN